MLLNKSYNHIYIRGTVGYIKFRTITLFMNFFQKLFINSLCISLNYRFYGGSIFEVFLLRNRKQRDSVIMLHLFTTPKIYSKGTLYSYKNLLVIHE